MYGHLAGREQRRKKMATVKIVQWNPERGFGFVQTEQGRAFLHCSVIEPRPAQGENLEGKEVEVFGVAREVKGLRVTGAEMPIPAQFVQVFVQTRSWGFQYGTYWVWTDGMTGPSRKPYLKLSGRYSGDAPESLSLSDFPELTAGTWKAKMIGRRRIEFLERISSEQEMFVSAEKNERDSNGGWLEAEIIEEMSKAQRVAGKDPYGYPDGNYPSVYLNLARKGFSKEEVVARMKADASAPEKPKDNSPELWYDHQFGVFTQDD
jgi:cold shock CspA family protein